jgi:hypothetical protein
MGGQPSSPVVIEQQPAGQTGIGKQFAEPAAASVVVTESGPAVDVKFDDSESFGAPAAKPGVAPVRVPAATMMFEPGPPVDTSPSNVERISAEPDNPKASMDEAKPAVEEEELYRPTPTRTRAKSSKKAASKERRAKPTRKDDDEVDSDKPAGSGNKTKIIVIAGAALLALVVIGVFAARSKDKPVSESPPPVEKLAPFVAPGETPPSAEPSLAAGQVPVEATQPAPSEKPMAPAKPVAHSPKPVAAEKPAHPEKASPAEPKAPASGKPTEEDYRRANEAYQRGNAKLFQGNSAGAIADFDEAVKLNPKDPAGQRGLGLAYAQSGKSAEAIKHLKLYLKAAPKANDRAIIEKRIDQLR